MLVYLEASTFFLIMLRVSPSCISSPPSPIEGPDKSIPSPLGCHLELYTPFTTPFLSFWAIYRKLLSSILWISSRLSVYVACSFFSSSTLTYSLPVPPCEISSFLSSVPPVLPCESPVYCRALS